MCCSSVTLILVLFFFFTWIIDAETSTNLKWSDINLAQLPGQQQCCFSFLLTQLRPGFLLCSGEECDQMKSGLPWFTLVWIASDGFSSQLFLTKAALYAYIARQVGIWFYGLDTDFIRHVDLHKMAHGLCFGNTEVNNNVRGKKGRISVEWGWQPGILWPRDEAGRKPVHANKRVPHCWHGAETPDNTAERCVIYLQGEWWLHATPREGCDTWGDREAFKKEKKDVLSE